MEILPESTSNSSAVLLKLILSVHWIRRRRYNLIPAESKFKNLVLDHQDKYMMKAQVKENQEKDKIGSKPDKNGKRGEAGKSQKQLQLKEEEKNEENKKKNDRKRMHELKVIKLLKKEEKIRAKYEIPPKFQYRDQSCQLPDTCGARDEP
nr:hypothetical protein [Tanacetum cinerariifolium]